MERREMIKREIATLEKALEKVNFVESLKSDWLFFNEEENLGHYLTTQWYALLLKILMPQLDHRQNLRLILESFKQNT